MKVSLKNISELCQKKHVIYDIKGVLKKNVDATL